TTTTTGAAELVTPECGVVLPDSEDIQALIQALLHLKSDSELRKRMGQTARYIAEQHSWTGRAQSYLALFKELAGYEHQHRRQVPE
ncbi:MAG TPA: hypothetical protein V6D48_19570, partial [Oculatellaceae cyanobacterium]